MIDVSRRSAVAITVALAVIDAVCFFLAPPPGLFAPEEGSFLALTDALAQRWWLGSALVTPSARIDPEGAFAGPFVRASGGRWYSTAPPLFPLVASLPYALLGTFGACAVSAAAGVATILIAAGAARRLSGLGGVMAAGSTASW